jgi:hypothetical protein
MKKIGAFILSGFLGTAVMAYGNVIVIDGFTCSNSFSHTGYSGTIGSGLVGDRILIFPVEI